MVMPSGVLQSVDFLHANGKPTVGLVRVRGEKNAARDLTIDEKAVVLDARSFQQIDYVFFRRFTDGRSSQVAAYIVDNSDENHNQGELSHLHHQVWLQGKAPLLYVAWPARIDVLACQRGPDFWHKGRRRYNPAETLRIAADISSQMDRLSRFSALRLADGTFWDDPDNRTLVGHDKAAHRLLIQAVVEADRYLDGKGNSVLRRLLLLMVLIKYLEDRSVFPGTAWFGKYHAGARTFFDVLKGGQPEEVYRLLKTLQRRFNGDIFDLSVIPETSLTKQALRTFADLVETKTLSKQRYLWDQFSFEHLPVEIISHLYQRFVEGGHGKVYTPPFLAALLLDHAMPYSCLSGKEHVLDPACGSGVFLVGAFRRLVNAWRSRNDWRRPTVEGLKEILRRGICGVDLDPDAIDLTAFSLSLAVCDALQPDVIWRELKFDRLRDQNLFQGDFFAFCLNGKQGSSIIRKESFDIVVGNPPFESELTADGEKVDKAARKQSHRDALPDRQTAYLFLEQCAAFLRRDVGRICLIQPHGFLYNRNVDAFRANILRHLQVEAVLDFVSIRKLYEADPKTVAVLARPGRPGAKHRIAHSTFRRTLSVKERICFELDHYDRHIVVQRDAETDPLIWRANLLGGGRLVEMSRRLRSMRTLRRFLDENVERKGWDYGEGFIAAKGGRREAAPFLTGRPLLPTDALTEGGLDKSQIDVVVDTEFRSAYTESRYTPPLILIKENATLPLALWNRHFLAYRDKIVGIHAPESEKSDLHSLYETLRQKHELYRFSCMLNGSQSLAGKATAILKQDIDMLPFPEDMDDLTLTSWEEILCQDVLKYMAEYVRLGHNSTLLRATASVEDLEEYSRVFSELLGSVYGNLQSSTPFLLCGLACQPFYFGERPDMVWLGDTTGAELRKLIYHEGKGVLRTVRVFRYYEGNVILVVKPDRLRYWIGSTAIRDADETLVDLRRQGY